MPQSLAKVYIHVVFSTKNRQPLIDDFIKHELFAYLGGICQRLDCHPLQVGGYLDHVHILCILSRKITLMKFMEEIKKRSSKWVKAKGPAYENFYWQDGYGVFSVSPPQTEAIISYIQRQQEHHQSQTFMDECRNFYRRYNMPFDERYVWD